ncbi:MAG: ATP-binding protein [Erysipelotrichaceae bacterium]
MEFFVILMATITKTFPPLCLLLITFRKRIRYSNIVNLCLIIIFILISSFASFILVKLKLVNGIFESFYALLLLIISIFILVIFLKDAYRIIFKIAFSVFLFKSLADSIVLTARLFSHYHVFISESSADPVSSYFIASNGLPAVFYDALFICISIPFFLYLIKIYLRPLVEREDDYSFWRYLWLVPLTFFILFRFIIYPSYFAESYDTYNYMLIISPIWIVCVFFVYFLILKMLIKTADTLQLQKELELTNLHIKMESEHYQNLQDGIEAMRKDRHDSRHRLLLLKSYIRDNDLVSLEHELDCEFNSLNKDNCSPICDNYALDVIVGHYLNKFKEQHITSDFKINIKKDVFIPPIDLSVLFGNLLENAYEAIQRQQNLPKFIQLKAQLVNNRSMILLIKNSYEGVIHESDQGFISSKRNEVGIGLKSVQAIVNKYQGNCKISYRNSVFMVNILLQDLDENKK